MKYYRNMTTDEVVNKEDAEKYVLDRLGITVTPKGKNGEMTVEQIDNIESTVDWFFSGNWIEEKIKEDDEPDLEYELELADREYQESLDRKWGLI